MDSSRAAYSRFVVAGYIQEQMTDAVLDRTLKSLMRRQTFGEQLDFVFHQTSRKESIRYNYQE